MSDTPYSRAKEIFLAALELSEEERGSFIERESGGDPDLRAEVESLLGFSDMGGGSGTGDILAAAESPPSRGWEGIRADPEAFKEFEELLRDRYRIDGEVGRGGMATVYRAQDLRHGRPVALKVLSPELTALLGPERFLREIRIVAQLHHPHILQLHDSGEEGGFLFYVMPLVEGGSARTKIEAGKGLEVEEAVRILRDVAEALAEAHSRGIVHRDIKPDNVLISGRNALVSDFGLAKAVSTAKGHTDLTGVGLPLGTPAYMAPEQVAGDPDIDFRADIYAFGVLAFELLAGRPPLTAPTPRELMAAHLTTPPPKLSELRVDLPPTLVELVHRCLEKKPEDRWQSSEELLGVLEGLARISIVGWDAKPGPARKRLGRWIRGSLVALPVVGFVALAIALRNREPPTPLDPNRVLVAGFVNETGDTALEQLGGIASDWVSRGLQEAGAVVILGSEFLSPDPLQADSAGRTGLARVVATAEAHDAGTVLTGAVYRLGDSIQLQAQLIDTRSEELRVALDPVSGSLASPLDAVDLLRRRIMTAANFLASPSQAMVPIKPPVYEAYREWVSALRLTGERDMEGALEGYLRAYALDSTFTVAQIMASGMMIGTGRFAGSDSILDVLEGRLESLTSLERLAYEAQRARLRGDLEGWLAGSRRISEIMPYSPGTEDLAEGPIFLNRPREAISFLEDLDFSQDFVRGWVLFWELYHDAHHMLGEFREALSVAERARRAEPASLRVTVIDIPTLAALGREEELSRRLNLASSMPDHPGVDLCEEMVNAAAELRAHGYDAAAGRMLRRFDSFFGSLSAEEAASPLRISQLVDARNLEGRHREALAEIQALAELYPDDVDVQGRLGRTAAAAGERAIAEGISLWLRDLDRPYLFGENTVWRARIAAILGDRDQAVFLLREAFSEGLHHGMWIHRDNSLEPLRGYPPFDELALPRG